MLENGNKKEGGNLSFVKSSRLFFVFPLIPFW